MRGFFSDEKYTGIFIESPDCSSEHDDCFAENKRIPGKHPVDFYSVV
jgi:hypothetical protein